MARRSPPTSIAVLPFENASGDPSVEYLTDAYDKLGSYCVVPALEAFPTAMEAAGLAGRPATPASS